MHGIYVLSRHTTDEYNDEINGFKSDIGYIIYTSLQLLKSDMDELN